MNRLTQRFSLWSAFVVLAAAFALPIASHADLLLEPYLGFHTGSWNDNEGDTKSMTGVTYGGRVGYENLGFMIGADVMSGSWTDKWSPSNTITPSDIGIFVGYNFPILVRVYGAYGFSSRLKFSTFDDTYRGTDIKLGLGFKVIPLLSINVEYITGTYTKDDDGSLDHNLTGSMMGLTVSIPLQI